MYLSSTVLVLFKYCFSTVLFKYCFSTVIVVEGSYQQRAGLLSVGSVVL